MLLRAAVQRRPALTWRRWHECDATGVPHKGLENLSSCFAEAAGADLAALAYVRRMRRMNLAGSRAAAAPSAPAAPAADGLAASWGLNWADKTFGQGLSSLTKGASL
jgi:hypothetical protein